MDLNERLVYIPTNMSSRIAAMHPVRYVKAFGVVSTAAILLYVFMIAKSAPLILLQIGMALCLTGMLAWPPKTFRMASVWFLWVATIASIVLRFFL